LVQRSADWPWSSLAIRCGEEKPLTLSDGPMALPRQWKSQADKVADMPLDEIETCVQRGRPFGDDKWILKTARELVLESSLRPRGRPKKEKTA
jgi:putative transposase